MGEPRTTRPGDAAETGTRWWELAVRALSAAPRDSVDHSDLYDLAAELVDTLRVLEDLTGVLSGRARTYAERGDLRDDAGADPTARLEAAALAATDAGRDITRALIPSGEFWSAVGHIGLQLDDTEHDEHDTANGDGGGLS